MTTNTLQPESITLPADLATRCIRDCFTQHGLYIRTLLNLDVEDRHNEIEMIWSLPQLLGLATLPGGAGRESAMQYFRARWDEFILPIVGIHDRQAFSAAMRATRTILAGGAALSFINHNNPRITAIEHGDYDFYCPSDTFEAFCTFLVASLHGIVVEEADEDELRLPNGRYDGQRFIRARRRIRTDSNVVCDVFSSATLCPLTPVASSYATHLFTFVTPDTFCIAYPELLFEAFAIRSPLATEDAQRDAQRRYSFMGWKFADNYPALYDNFTGGHSDGCAPIAYCPSQRRFFGDGSCVTVTFRSHPQRDISIRFPSLTSGLSTTDNSSTTWTTAWTFGGDACANPTKHMKISSMINDIVVLGLPSLY